MLRHTLILRVVATIAVLSLYLSGVFIPLRDIVQDARFRLVQRPASKSILLVEIDAKSIATEGSWPWSRALHGRMIDQLRQAGASVAAFDIDFSAVSTPDGDAAFAEALERTARTSTVAVLAALQQAPSARDDGRKLISRPLPRFAAAWEGSVDTSSDGDGLMRRFARGEVFGGVPIPSMPVMLAGLGDSADGPFSIDFGIDAEDIDRISAIDVIEGRFDPERIHGKTVLVGATAVELRDFYQVPRYGTVSGALLQILAAESLLQGRALQQTSIYLPLGACALVLLLAWLWRRLEIAVVIPMFALAAACAEGIAVAVQALFPQMFDTSSVHVELMTMALLAVAFEIRARRIKMLESRDNADRLQVMLDRVIADSFTGIIVVDQYGVVLAVSRVASETLGLVGRETATISIDGELPSVLQQALAEAHQRATRGAWLPDAPREAEFPLRPDQPPSVVEFVTTLSHVGGVTATRKRPGGDDFAICLTFQDVTARRRAQADVARLAHFNSLTGLANRHSFLSHLASALSQCSAEASSCLAVLSFDLDRFKLVNDRLGHGCGDALLRSVADRIRMLERDGDLAARLGGDEFAMLVERQDLSRVEATAEQLAARLSGTYEIGPYQVTVAVSVGIAHGRGYRRSRFAQASGCGALRRKGGGRGPHQALRRSAGEDGRSGSSVGAGSSCSHSKR